MPRSTKRFARVIAVTWEGDWDNNLHPAVIARVGGHELQFYDHPTESWQVIAIAPVTLADWTHALSADGADACAQLLPRVLGAPPDWGNTGVALARIADDLYEHGRHGAAKRWTGKRLTLTLAATVNA